MMRLGIEVEAAAGVLTGNIRSRTGWLGLVGVWRIGASNWLNPSRPSTEERAVWRIVSRLRTDTSCSAYRDCISDWIRRLIGLVELRVLNNEALDRDAEVRVFLEGRLNRRVFALRLIRELEIMAGGMNIVCGPCPPPFPPLATACTDSTFITLTMNFELPDFERPGDRKPHDMTLLHELMHKAGFSYTYLPRTYSGVEIERMTHELTYRVFDGRDGRYSIGCP